MEWPGVLLIMNGTGQRILTVIIWFMQNDKNYSKNKTPSYFKIQIDIYSGKGRIRGVSGSDQGSTDQNRLAGGP